MASETVHMFINAVNESPDLRAKTQKALEGSKDPGAFVAVAKAAGYVFTNEEARGYFDEVLSRNRAGELGEEDLGRVSGGIDSSFSRTTLNDTVKMFEALRFREPPNWIGWAPDWPTRG